MKYTAFISYKHSDFSRRQAIAIEKGIKNLAKPWLERPRYIFRDEQHISSGQNISEVIKNGLLSSEYLIYLASEESAKSPWCQKELEIWCNELGKIEKLIIVKLSGDIKIDLNSNQVNWRETDAIPYNIADNLNYIPFFEDLSWANDNDLLDLQNSRFKSHVNRILARIKNTTPEELSDEDVRIYRKNVRQQRIFKFATSTILFIVLLLVGVTMFLSVKNQHQSTQISSFGTELEQRIEESSGLETNYNESTIQLEQQKGINAELDAEIYFLKMELDKRNKEISYLKNKKK